MYVTNAGRYHHAITARLQRVGWVVDKLPILDPVATAQSPEARVAD